MDRLDLRKFKVEPRHVTELTPDEKSRAREEFHFGGCAGLSALIGFFFLMLAFQVLEARYPNPTFSQLDSLGNLAAVISLVLGISLSAAFLAARNARRTATRLQAIQKGKREEAGRAAKEATQRAAGYLTKAVAALQEFPDLLDGASEELAIADREFSERAYSSFWDAIERSAQNLREYCQQVAKLQSSQSDYESTLAGQRHNFPPFPLRGIVIPDPSPQFQQLRAAARRGETDIDFASILEHKKTRGVLLEGFRAVSNAISSLEGSLGSSFGQMQSALGDEAQRSRDQLAEFHRFFEAYAKDHLKLLQE